MYRLISPLKNGCMDYEFRTSRFRTVYQVNTFSILRQQALQNDNLMRRPDPIAPITCIMRLVFPGPDANVSADQLVPTARRNPSASEPVRNLVVLDHAPCRMRTRHASPVKGFRTRDELRVSFGQGSQEGSRLILVHRDSVDRISQPWYKIRALSRPLAR
jgi:hypothetical protein